MLDGCAVLPLEEAATLDGTLETGAVLDTGWLDDTALDEAGALEDGGGALLEGTGSEEEACEAELDGAGSLDEGSTSLEGDSGFSKGSSLACGFSGTVLAGLLLGAVLLLITIWPAIMESGGDSLAIGAAVWQPTRRIIINKAARRSIKWFCIAFSFRVSGVYFVLSSGGFCRLHCAK